MRAHHNDDSEIARNPQHLPASPVLLGILAPLIFVALSCGSDSPVQTQNPDPPGTPTVPEVETVTLTSAKDTLLALGSTSQIDAEARDAEGGEVDVDAFDWSSSDGDVVTVSTDGIATAEAVGTATVAADEPDSGAGGTLSLRVVDADLAAVSALSGDAFAAALLGALTPEAGPPTQAAWDGCGSGADAENVADIVDCVEGVREQIGGGPDATDPTDATDEALFAVLALFTDGIERNLGL